MEPTLRDDELPAFAVGIVRGSCGDLREACPTTAALLDLLGRPYSLPILYEFACTDDPRRFSELERRLDLSPTTLSARLTEFTETGLLTRTPYDEMPPRVEYEATEKLETLVPALQYLRVWGDWHVENHGPLRPTE